MSCCNGNPWDSNGGLNTQEICGDFTEPTNPDLGQCFPYREKRSCERPSIPIPECNDTSAYAEVIPGRVPPFVIIATIFDENCLPIQDENGAPIMGAY